MNNCEVIKSTLAVELAPPAFAGEHPWPADPAAMAALYQMDPTHARCCQIKAEGVAGQGLAGDGGDRLTALFERGGEDLVRLALDLEVYGNGFIELVRDRTGVIRSLRLLPAWSMTRKTTGGFRQRIFVDDREKVTDFTAKNIVMVRVPCPMGGHYSLPGWFAGAGVVELLFAITRYNALFFEHNGVPEHVIIHKGPDMGREKRAAIRDFFTNDFKGLENSRKTLFISLPDGQEIEFKAVGKGDSGKFVELMKVARDILPAAHGVPPRLVGIISPGALGGGSEAAMQMQMFEQFTLAPARRRFLSGLSPIAAEIGVDIQKISLPPVDLTPPGDGRDQVAGLVEAGIITSEEARAWLNVKAETQVAKSAAAGMASLLEDL